MPAQKKQRLAATEIPREAWKLAVRCGGCGDFMLPSKVLAVVVTPQHLGTAPYAMIEFSCSTVDCGTLVPMEVDL